MCLFSLLKTINEMHSSDITILIFLLWSCCGVTLCTTPACFIYCTFIDLLCMVPTLIDHFVYLLFIITGEPIHIASKERNGISWPSHISYHLKAKYPLCIVVNPLHSSMTMNREKFLCNQSNHKKNMDDSWKGSHHVLPANRHFWWMEHKEDTSPWRMHCILTAVGTSQDEAVSNSDH